MCEDCISECDRCPQPSATTVARGRARHDDEPQPPDFGPYEEQQYRAQFDMVAMANRLLSRTFDALPGGGR